MTTDAEQPEAPDPLHAFRFHVKFREARGEEGQEREICHGAFSEITGLEATMEPVAISEGGLNWGQPQRVGRTTFSTVILRRGMTTTRHLWTWFSHVTKGGKYSHRLHVTIVLRNRDNADVVEWTLSRALPVKLKLADLNATSQEVAIEELHLVHEGIDETLPGAPATPDSGTPVPDVPPQGDTRFA